MKPAPQALRRAVEMRPRGADVGRLARAAAVLGVNISGREIAEGLALLGLPIANDVPPAPASGVRRRCPAVDE